MLARLFHVRLLTCVRASCCLPHAACLNVFPSCLCLSLCVCLCVRGPVLVMCARSSVLHLGCNIFLHPCSCAWRAGWGGERKRGKPAHVSAQLPSAPTSLALAPNPALRQEEQSHHHPHPAPARFCCRGRNSPGWRRRPARGLGLQRWCMMLQGNTQRTRTRKTRRRQQQQQSTDRHTPGCSSSATAKRKMDPPALGQ